MKGVGAFGSLFAPEDLEELRRLLLLHSITHQPSTHKPRTTLFVLGPQGAVDACDSGPAWPAQQSAVDRRRYLPASAIMHESLIQAGTVCFWHPFVHHSQKEAASIEVVKLQRSRAGSIDANAFFCDEHIHAIVAVVMDVRGRSVIRRANPWQTETLSPFLPVSSHSLHCFAHPRGPRRLLHLIVH